MGVSDSKLREQFAAQPNQLFQWLDEGYRGGDPAKALRLFRLEPQQCLSLRYTKAGEPDATVDKKRAEALAKFAHHNAEQSTAMHWLCSSRFIGRDQRRLRLQLGFEMLAFDPTSHHAVDANGLTPFGQLLQRITFTYTDNTFEDPLKLMLAMLEIGLGAQDHVQIVTHLRRFRYYICSSAPEMHRLHRNVWNLALKVAFPEGTDATFRRALLLLATSGRSPDDVQGGSAHEVLTEALAVPDAVKPGWVWTAYQEELASYVCGKRARIVPNTLPVWLLYLKLQHITSVRAILRALPNDCDEIIRDHVAAVSGPTTTLFHLATGNGSTFKDVEESDRYRKLVEPLCIELLFATKRLFPSTWREACWLLKDEQHRTAIDNARELQMNIFLEQHWSEK